MMITCILTSALFFAGCGIKNDYTKKQMYRLSAEVNDPADPSNRSAGVPLVVRRLDISPEFGGAGFVYRVDQNRFTQDYYNNYMTPPARMISDVMFEALVNSLSLPLSQKTGSRTISSSYGVKSQRFIVTGAVHPRYRLW
jgi:hypothetical protein